MIAGAATFGSLALAGGAMAQAIVVRSTGPSAAQYPQGRKLPANASVSLKPGDKVTVIDKAGSRVLSGPGNFTLNSAVERGGGSVMANMMVGGGSRARTGAVRGAPVGLEAPTAPDNIWAIDVTKGGTYCVADPASLVLWRPNRADAITGKLAANGKTSPVAWKAGSALKLWPADVPVVDGMTYSFTGPVTVNSSITLKKLAEVPTDQMQVASMLAEKGCNAQLDVIASQATSAQ
jgi:hypothetical protein